MSLYQKVRPSAFDEVVGAKNKEVIASLRPLVEGKDPPHAYVLVGPSGCGKTTIGRLIAKALGVEDEDYREVDSADFRGIDTIRDIRHAAQYRALKGTRRCWLLDECFAAGTPISLPDGRQVGIDTLKPGDKVVSLVGPSAVKHVFRNVVFLDRIVRVELTDGQVLFTTTEHLFLKKSGHWIKACCLCPKDLLLSLSSNTMSNVGFVRGSNAKTEDLSGVRDTLCPEGCETGLLLTPLRMQPSAEIEETAESGGFDLSRMWGGIYTEEEQRGAEILLSSLREQNEWIVESEAGPDTPMFGVLQSRQILSGQAWAARDVQSEMRQHLGGSETDREGSIGGDRSQDRYRREAQFGYQHGARSRIAPAGVGEDERKQSILSARIFRESQDDETDKGDIACLDRGARRERETDRTAETSRFLSRMVDGGRGPDRLLSVGQEWVSDLLQVGYRERCPEAGYRDRRGWASQQTGQGTRCEEGTEAVGVRVASVEIYQRGRNDGRFVGAVGDRERSLGFTIFYDLEVEDDPSYFAAGVAVHNCHRLPALSQDALLKGLEDPPSHCFYVLCTTEPDKLLPTILSRCAQYQVYPLTDEEMVRLLNRVARKEGADVSRVALQRIAESSQGRPRAALTALQKLLANGEAGEAALASIEDIKSKSIDLCRELMKPSGWKSVAAILSGLKDEEPESVRRAVMGYAAAVLLRGEGNDRAGVVLDEFKSPTYDSGWPGLILAAYTVVRQA